MEQIKAYITMNMQRKVAMTEEETRWLVKCVVYHERPEIAELALELYQKMVGCYYVYICMHTPWSVH